MMYKTEYKEKENNIKRNYRGSNGTEIKFKPCSAPDEQTYIHSSSGAEDYRELQDMVYRSPEAVEYRRMQEMVYNSPKAVEYRAMQAMVHNSPEAVEYRRMQEMVYNSPEAAEYRAMCEEIQRKGTLKISDPADAAEIEAERVADEVMKAPDLTPLAPLSSMARGGEQEDTLQPVYPSPSYHGEGRGEAGEVESRINSLSGGEPLSKAEKEFFEPRFGADFSNVKIHTDNSSAETASAINARAYNKGEHIVFAKGEYQPETDEGKKLMAHELAHVVQGGRAGVYCKENDESVTYNTDKTDAQKQVFKNMEREFIAVKNRFIKGTHLEKYVKRIAAYYTKRGDIVTYQGMIDDLLMLNGCKDEGELQSRMSAGEDFFEPSDRCWNADIQKVYDAERVKNEQNNRTEEYFNKNKVISPEYFLSEYFTLDPAVKAAIAGVIFGYLDSQTFNAYHKELYDDIMERISSPRTYAAAFALGSLASAGQGMYEIILGLGGEFTGFIMDASGVLLAPGLALNVGSAVLVAHGVAGSISGLQNTSKALDDIMLSKGNDGGKSEARDYKKLDAKELSKRLGTDKETMHKKVKDQIKKDFKYLCKQLGTDNPDILIDSSGKIVLQNLKTKKTIETGISLKSYRP